MSSERRVYIPMGYLTPDTFASNKLRILPSASLWHFGVLQSRMHMAWMRAVAGRLESRYQYSVYIVYNNFPWTLKATEAQEDAVAKAAHGVLDARTAFPTATLADLYDPLTMPPQLLKAHEKLDRAVDAAYRYKGANDDAARVAFLFEMYNRMTSLFVDSGKKARRAKTARA